MLMASLEEYFRKNRYQGKYLFGDRVTGVYRGVRWVGTVGNDTVVSEEVGPQLHIQLDLPIKVDGKYTYILITGHRGVKKLTTF